MTARDADPFFSIIISTRNRPELFLTALRSVMRQSFKDREILVVVDGSNEANLTTYKGLQARFSEICFHFVPQRPNGHGQSYSMNLGVDLSTGRYLCFLDDDDYWTDEGYLTEVHASISAATCAVDIHFSNQKAVHADGTEQEANVWIEDLIPRVKDAQRVHGDSYSVDTAFMLSSAGFAHLNCSVFRREFYHAIGGMDESIRYENDRDVFIRAVDSAKTMLFSTHFIALHNIPVRERKSNLSTASTEIERLLFQLRVYDKNICHGNKPETIRVCTCAKAWILKRTARLMADEGRYRIASHYARQALAGGFNIRWLLYAMYLSGRGRFAGNK